MSDQDAPSQPKVAFISGANGISGNALVDHLMRTSPNEWSKIIVSSRSPLKQFWQDPRVEFIAVDFLNPVEKIITQLKSKCHGVTHAFFTSYVHDEEFAKLPLYNVPLFENFLNAMDAVAGISLQRVCLQTGGKNYGVHLGPMVCPATEDLPRYDDHGENFYYNQEDFLFKMQAQRNWSYSIIRPQAIIGYSPSKNGISESITLALYFLISRELDEPARWTGSNFFYHCPDDHSYAPGLAEMSVWAMTSEHTKNQAYNHGNGDTVVWKYFFPKIAAYFGASVEEPEFTNQGASERPQHTILLTQWAKDKREVWHRVCDKYGGSKEAFDWATWDAMDWVAGKTWPTLISLNKARKHGWMRQDDTFEAWLKTYKVYEQAGVLPSHEIILSSK